MTAQLLPPGQITFFDDDGNPLSNGLVYFYIPSTTTFKNTWQDRGQLSLNTNPVQLDAAGRATIWGDGVYRQRVFDELGNEIWDKIVSTVDTSNNTGASGYYGGFTAVGGETSFPLLNQDGDSFTVAAGAEITIGIYINGVKQQLENYSTDGSGIITLTNSTVLAANDLVYYEQAGGINLNVPGPGSITSYEQFGSIVTFNGKTLQGGNLYPDFIKMQGTAFALKDDGSVLQFNGYGNSNGARGILRLVPASSSTANGLILTAGAPGVSVKLAVDDLGGTGDANINMELAATGSSGRIIINRSRFPSVPAPPSGTRLQIIGEASTPCRNLVDAFDNTSVFDGRRANGTIDSPSALLTDDEIAELSVKGYGASGYSSTGRAHVRAHAAENWTDSAQGTYWAITTTPIGSTTPQIRAIFNNDGKTSFGATATSQVNTSGGALQTINGVTFPAVQSPVSDANTLDDYEEGTFTPTLYGGTVAGTQTYGASTYGRYTKVGDVAHVQGRVTLAAKDGAASGIVFLGGLPFTSFSAGTQALYLGLISNVSNTAGYSFFTAVLGGSSTAGNIFENGSGIARLNVAMTAIANNTDIQFGSSYKTA